MIKVVYTYQTKSEHLAELMEKFKLSAGKQFETEIDNVKIEMFKQVKADDVYIILDIYYNNIEEYQIRKQFEENNAEWQKIWFAPDNKHIEVSVELMEVM